jgi:hypothetical protein
MYIITKQKDYYDGVVGTMGVDKTIIYERQTIEVENPDRPQIFRRHSWWDRKPDSMFVQLDNFTTIKPEFKSRYGHSGFFILGFCGKLYIGWKLYTEVKRRGNPIPTLLTEYTYDFYRVKEIVKTENRHGYMEDVVNYIRGYDAMQLFRDLNAPVFVYDDDYERNSIIQWGNINTSAYRRFAINPLLKDYQFYKVFDAFQAFQEVQMFMGGVLGRGEKEILEVADKYKITQHGFDYKWSFRKMPEKNK